MDKMMSIQDQVFQDIYDKVKDPDGDVDLKKLRHRIHRQGILADDPRIQNILDKFEQHTFQSDRLKKSEAKQLFQDDLALIENMVNEDHFTVARFDEFKKVINEIYLKCKGNNPGQLA